MRLWKFTGPGGETHGSFRWPLPDAEGPGEWVDLHPGSRRALEESDLCSSRVLHLTDAAHLLDWLGAELYEAEADESRGLVAGLDKVGVRRARLVRRVEAWNDRTARLFACDCAEDALPHAAPESREVLAAAIATARRFADGLATREELAAAWAAARAAAWDAALAVARAAALAASWAAARDAEWAVALAAALAAEWAAARDAEWDAARDRYRVRLAEMLGIES